MTATGDPVAMVQLLLESGRVGDQRRRRFACLCAEVVWNQWDDQGFPAEADCRRAVVVGRRFVEGRATDAERRTARREMAVHVGGLQEAVMRIPGADDLQALFRAALAAEAAVADTGPEAATSAVRAVAWNRWEWRFERWAPPGHPEAGLACLLREVFGPRPIALDPAWQTGTVRQLAQAVRDRRLPDGTLDPARLAVLADALEEAGGDNAEVLRHLREGAAHVGDCWAVGLLLGQC